MEAEVNVSSFVKTEVSKHAAVIFSKSNCPFSDQAKDVIEAAAQQITAPCSVVVHELDHLHARGTAVRAHLFDPTDQRTVPNIFIWGQHVGGCEDVLNLSRKGELVALLGKPQAQTSDVA